jgi:hypothetical protein
MLDFNFWQWKSFDERGERRRERKEKKKDLFTPTFNGKTLMWITAIN